MCGLAWEDVDLKHGVINVGRASVEGVIKVPKEKSRKRRVDLIDEAKKIYSISLTLPLH